VRRGLAALSAGALVLSLACSSPTGIRRVDGRTVHRTLTANVLSTGDLEDEEREVLRRSAFFAAHSIIAFDGDGRRGRRRRRRAVPERLPEARRLDPRRPLPHSRQGNFATIEEIRRILREHAGIPRRRG
jgi:hypothetical protein